MFITAQKIRDPLKFYDNNVTDMLEQESKKFSSSDLILIGGAFNARVGTEPDNITEQRRI